MSASSEPALRTIAFELARALDRYQLDFDEMIESWMDAHHYRAVTRELHDIRLMRGSLPEVSGEMADVLIRHVELVHSVWKVHSRPSGETPEQLKRLRARHRCAVDAMRRKCQTIFQ
jgi:hypothetical protein